MRVVMCVSIYVRTYLFCDGKFVCVSPCLLRRSTKSCSLSLSLGFLSLLFSFLFIIDSMTAEIRSEFPQSDGRFGVSSASRAMSADGMVLLLAPYNTDEISLVPRFEIYDRSSGTFTFFQAETVPVDHTYRHGRWQAISPDGLSVTMCNYMIDDETGMCTSYDRINRASMFAETGNITGSGAVADSWFGYGPPVYSEDSLTLAVGSFDDFDGYYRGAVHIFERSSRQDAFTEAQKIVADVRSEKARLGVGGAALSSDGRVLLTSASTEGVAGLLYVFQRNETSHFTQFQTFGGSDPDPGGQLGSLNPSISGDGLVVSGCSYYDTNITGCCYIFQRSSVSDTFSQTQKIVSPAAATDNRFGIAGFSLSKDGLIGSVCEPRLDDLATGLSNVGACYIYTRNSVSDFFLKAHDISPSSLNEDDTLGYSSNSVSARGLTLVACRHDRVNDTEGSCFVYETSHCVESTLGNGTVLPKAGMVDHVYEYFCDPGFELMGPAERTCLLNGTWSNSVPMCVGR